MPKLSKRTKAAQAVADLEKTYPLEEAVKILQQMPKPKFDETVELAIKLGVDPRQSDQMVRGVVKLPNGSGKKVRVAVFTTSPEAALAAGATHAGLDDLIAKVQDGWTDFDVAMATPEAMKQVRQVARVLGPRGLMPNPKSGTVTDDIEGGLKEVMGGRVEYKMDKTANVQVVAGKRSFTEDQIRENVDAIIGVLASSKPAGVKGRYIKTMTLTATMSPGVKLDAQHFASL
jgi:large subunit ribosomal protein L1